MPTETQLAKIRALARLQTPIEHIAATAGLEIGEVASIVAGGEILNEVVTGGASAGSPVVRKFAFAFDTPDLLTGTTVYTPTPGEILFDAWVQVDEAWDGTSPQFDFGSFRTIEPRLPKGIFKDSALNTGVPLDLADVPLGLLESVSASQLGLRVGAVISSLRDGAALAMPTADHGFSLYAVSGASVNTNPDALKAGFRAVPAPFTGDPIKICVSQNGQIYGDDPGSTQGSAVLLLLTATPVE